ncbi:uncharacterized protein Dsimw501_GD27967 [Drosophila simulans]|uniref:Uncharacterized protein n=1 Tax=Drosophila simulans TaxID=7240 RepID=A0A0J9RVR6_DROSI|nr:uncharacterized protein Dsimw501_GD27967 [Drosophila simulans]
MKSQWLDKGHSTKDPNTIRTCSDLQFCFFFFSLLSEKSEPCEVKMQADRPPTLFGQLRAPFHSGLVVSAVRLQLHGVSSPVLAAITLTLTDCVSRLPSSAASA